MHRLLFIAVICLLISSTSSAAREYRAGYTDAKWAFEGNQVSCTLSHEIPRYGFAHIRRKAGVGLSFQMEVSRPAPQNGQAALYIVPPNWKRDDPLESVTAVEYNQGLQPFEVRGEAVGRMLTALELGRVPRLGYKDWYNPTENVVVDLYAINIREPLKQFMECSQKLFPYGLAQLQERRLYFDPQSDVIGRQGEDLLDRMARYISLDPEVKGVLLVDAIAGLNPRNPQRALFERRAEKVKDALVRQGLKQGEVRIATQGEDPGQWRNGQALPLYLFGPDSLDRVYFSKKKYGLTDESQRVLQILVDYLQVRPLQKPMTLDGHTDQVGRRPDNNKLAKRRVESIKRWLIARGVSSGMIETRAYGEVFPDYPNDTEANRRLNRRVEIYFGTPPVRDEKNRKRFGDDKNPIATRVSQ